MMPLCKVGVISTLVAVLVNMVLKSSTTSSPGDIRALCSSRLCAGVGLVRRSVFCISFMGLSCLSSR